MNDKKFTAENWQQQLEICRQRAPVRSLNDIDAPPELRPEGRADADNAIAIHKWLSGQPDLPKIKLVQNYRNIWEHLSQVVFVDYVKERWLIKDGGNRFSRTKKMEDLLERRLKYLKARPRDNAISRLWLGGEMTYISNSTDPYQTTRIVLINPGFYQRVAQSKLFFNKKLLNILLYTIQDNRLILGHNQLIAQLLRQIDILIGTRKIYLLENAEITRIIQEKADLIVRAFHDPTINLS